MHSLILIFVIFIAFFIGFTGYSLAKDKTETNDSALEQLSKYEYANKLQKLSPDSDNWQEPIGAMCYKPAAQPSSENYICPVCGEMTLYPIYSGIKINKLPYYRSLVKKITKLDVKLDESQLCKKCSPNAKSRELCLVVKTSKNSKPHKTCNIDVSDIILLQEYSEGLKEHDLHIKKVPLTDYKARLEELLGITIKTDKNK